MVSQLLNEGKRGQGHHQQKGKEYQVAVLEALARRLLDAVQDPVGCKVEQDGRKGEIQDFHARSLPKSSVKQHQKYNSYTTRHVFEVCICPDEDLRGIYLMEIKVRVLLDL